MNFQLDLAAALTSYVPAVLLMPLFIRLLHRWQLMDEPDDRKLHSRSVPAYGGVIIFLGYIISVLIWIPLSDWAHLKFILLTQVIMILFGLRDDWSELKPLEKLSGQVLSSCIVVFLVDIRIENFYDLSDGYSFPVFFSYAISIFVIIGLTNAFNLIDGIDGLAGAVSCLILFCLGIWFTLIGETTFSVLSFGLLGAILAFLFFNWQPANIFMGDTGSLFVGITISILTIKAMNLNFQLSQIDPFKFFNTITIGICLLVFPILDTLRVMIIRISNGLSPFNPDRRHIHHVMLDHGWNHRKSVLVILLINVVFISLAILTKGISDLIMLPVMVVLLIIISAYISMVHANALKKVGGVGN